MERSVGEERHKPATAKLGAEAVTGADAARAGAVAAMVGAEALNLGAEALNLGAGTLKAGAATRNRRYLPTGKPKEHIRL